MTVLKLPCGLCAGSIVVALGFYFPIPLSANDTLTEEDFLADIPAVLSASRLSQTKTHSPSSITVIDRETIEASGAVELAELLRLVPGFQVSHVNGNSFAVTYHGLSFGFPRKIQVLVDGRSVYRPLLSNVDWTTLGIAVENIEYIEVVRGPNVPAYGSNAVMATINIVTRQPFEDQGNLFQGALGDIGTDNVLFRHANTLGDLDYRISARHVKDEGFEGVADSKNIDDFNVRAQYSTGNRNVLDFSFGYVYGEMGLGQSGVPLDPVREKEIRNSHAHIRWTQSYSSSEELYIQAYYNKYETRDEFSNTISGFLEINPADVPVLFGGQVDQVVVVGIQDGISERSELEMQHSLKPASSLRLAWGTTVRRDVIKGKHAFDQEDYLGGWGVNFFLNSEWQLMDPLLVNFGIMVEKLSGTRRYNSPRLALNWKLDENNAFRLSGSRAHRAPSVFERNHLWVVRFSDGGLMHVFYASDPDLKPEQLISYEAAYLLELPALNLSFDLKFFRERSSNLILAPKDPAYTQPYINDGSGPARVWINNGYADTKGLEFQLTYKPGFQTMASLQYSYARTKGFLIEQVNPLLSSVAEDNVPRHTASVLVKHSLDRDWWGSVLYHRVSAMEWAGDGDHLSSYSRWDLQLVRKLEFGLDSSSLNLTVHNLLDRRYLEFRKENSFERRVYLKFSAEF